MILANTKLHVEVDTQYSCLVMQEVQILVVLAKGLEEPLLSVLILVVQQESTDAPAIETDDRRKCALRYFSLAESRFDDRSQEADQARDLDFSTVDDLQNVKRLAMEQQTTDNRHGDARPREIE